MLALSKICRKQASTSLGVLASRNFYKVSTVPVERFVLSNELFVSHEENYFQPPLVIQHGILGSRTNWRSIAHHLCNLGRDVMTLDLRNSGESPHSSEMNYDLMAEDVFRTVRHVLPTEFNVDLMGHSMGGKVAMLTALRHPDIISRVIAIDILPTKVVSPGAAFVRKLFDVLREVKINRNAPSHAAAVKDVLAQLLAKFPDEQVCNWLTTNIDWNEEEGAFWRCNTESIEANVDFLVSFPDVNCAPFTKPVLFVQGEKSKHMDIPNREEIARHFFPNASFAVVKDAGHWVHADKPHEFIEVVHDFLSKPI